MEETKVNDHIVRINVLFKRWLLKIDEEYLFFLSLETHYKGKKFIPKNCYQRILDYYNSKIRKIIKV